MSTFKRFLAVADNHGALVCDRAMKKALDFSETWKPHYRIHLGDLWDFAALRNGASPEERADGIADDFRAGLEFLDAFKPHFLTLGNHDDRIWLTSTKCREGVIREACAKLASDAEDEFRKRRITFVPYHVSKFLRMPEGGPKLIHGFRSSLYPAKAHFENWGACIHGHVHKPDSHGGRHVDGGQAFSLGCLANLDALSYADRTPAKLGWRQGFLFGLINTKTGEWNAWHATNENGHWISPHGIL